MKNNDNPWTQREIDWAVSLWNAGKSAAEISLIIPKRSRNAVIGLIDRQRDKGTIIATTHSHKVSCQKGNKTKAAKKVNKYETPAAVEAAEKYEDNSTPPEHALHPAKTEPRKHCHWPYGNPQSMLFVVCAAPVVKGCPYCSKHMNIAYRPAPKKETNYAVS